MTDAGKKRRRPAVSCTLCRKRKIRCNRQLPCSNCLRSKSGSCRYGDASASNRSYPSASSTSSHINSHDEFDASSAMSSTAVESETLTFSSSVSAVPSTAASTPPGIVHPGPMRAQKLKRRIPVLDMQPSPLGQSPGDTLIDQPTIETTTSHLGGTIHVHCERTADSRHQPIARGLSHKTRLLGQSHWAITAALLVRDIAEVIETHGPGGNASKAWGSVEKCKVLARKIKSKQSPPWPVPCTSQLPAKQVADELIAAYLRTSEALYRVIHIPSFYHEYENLWSLGAPKDTAFVIQVKLILAIGATVYDDRFTLRPDAIRWVCEAQTWAAGPKFKSKLNIQALQIDILLLIAQEKVGVHGKSAWVSAGTVMRKALFMGLHRDPSRLPPKSVFVSEMRRRLWNTLLELDIHYSFAFGGPALVSMNSFDTEPPANLDDEQLLAGSPIPKSLNVSTQMSIPLALRETLPVRLVIIKLLNDLHPQQNYDETLRLDANLRIVYKSISRRLDQCSRNGDNTAPTKLSLRIVDVIMNRYLSALHVPYLVPSRHESSFAYSRKVALESAVRTWYSLSPVERWNDMKNNDRAGEQSEDMEWPRLATCSSGFYPESALHAALLVATELIMQIQDDESIGSVLLRPDLLDVLKDVEKFCVHVVEAGETNIKGSLLLNVVSAYVDCLTRGLGKEQMSAKIIEAVQKTTDICLPLLKATLGDGVDVDEATAGASISQPDGSDANDWRYMSLDEILGPDYGELLGLNKGDDDSDFASFMGIF